MIVWCVVGGSPAQRPRIIEPSNHDSPTQSPGSSSQATTIVPSPLEGCEGCAYERENTKSQAPSPGCGYAGGPPAHHGRRGCNQWDGTSPQASPVGSYSPCPHSRRWENTICDEPSPPPAHVAAPADHDTTQEFDSIYDEPSPPAAQLSVALAKTPTMARPTAAADPDTTQEFDPSPLARMVAAESAPAASLLSNRRSLQGAME